MKITDQMRAEVAEICRTYRKRHKFSQLEFALILNTNPNVISGIENKRPFTSGRVIRDILEIWQTEEYSRNKPATETSVNII